ncbi:MAG TPA: hypothetical protein VFO95_08365 [Gemmatimonadales bacterium]|nr:hypothetical protein [Gemmatimonadales bacterium]
MYALLISLAPLVAGEIFGDVRMGEGYVADVPIQLTCGAEVVQARTDSTGSYRIRTKGSGKCKLQVTYKDQKPVVEVVVFEQPTRYRLILEDQKGTFILKRV